MSPFPHLDRLGPLPSAAAMRAADAAAISAGLAPEMLMETAGRGAAHVLRRLWPDRIAGAGSAGDGTGNGQRVQVLCGPGGNGGDGYVLARVLAEAGIDVDVVAVAPPARADTRRMHAALVALASSLPGRVRLVDFESVSQLSALAAPGVRVDALVGTGARLPLAGPMGEIAAWLAAQRDASPRIPVLALDLPSGLDADTGATAGPAVCADATATFASETPGLRFGHGPALAGRVAVVSVGVPRGLLAGAMAAHGGAWASTDAWAAAVLPRRAADAHKFSAGHVVVVAGSADYVGAPQLAARAAGRACAGYVRLATDARVAARLADRLAEIPVTPLPAADNGLDPDSTRAALAPDLQRAHALVAGPGLGRDAGTQATVRALLADFEGPAVVDADALAALDDAWLCAHGRASWVLTPHAGELARLAGADTPLDLTDRLAVARSFAARWGVVLVVKGLPSVVAMPSGEAFVGGAHSTGLATAGTGDVLAGMTGAFAAQGLPAEAAALLALHTGGRAAQAYARTRAAATMRASDLLAHVPRVLRRLERTTDAP